jgi:murein DD-endopeptidase MepM/ murein hydrolase activator NlpD
MGEPTASRPRLLRVAVAVALAGLVGACAGEPPDPAPVIMKGGEPGVAGEGPIVAMPGRPFVPLPRARFEARQIVVRPGQSLGRIALEYHVPQRAIIAANHLVPPYKVEIGQRLAIPGAGGPPRERLAALPPPTAMPPAPRPSSEIIPLDGPPPPPAAERSRPAAPPPAVRSRPAEPTPAEEARAETAAAPQLPHGGRLPWPVQGKILAAYGVAAGGAHNDGINIAAPRGTPVRSIDAGVVAYAGNELRGYGNLVLVKHANGLISAYAHCEELLVRKGERVARGQVIAKVGATGGVNEPQLHFELRRGKSALDPREFLGPAPGAAHGEGVRQG